MNFEKENKALVIVGSWNKYILTEEWVSKFLLSGDKIESIEYPLNYDGSLKFNTKELIFFIAENRFIFIPKDYSDEVYNKIHQIVSKLVDNLPHTPITAFGINFGFEVNENETLDSLFSINDNLETENLKLINASIARAYSYNDSKLNFKIIKENTNYKLSFNFHFDVNDFYVLKGKFEITTFDTLKEFALNILYKKYKLKINQ